LGCGEYRRVSIDGQHVRPGEPLGDGTGGGAESAARVQDCEPGVAREDGPECLNYLRGRMSKMRLRGKLR
jgi:hypothetical protein